MRKWITAILAIILVCPGHAIPVPAQMEGAIEDLKTLVQDTDAGRLDALKTLLSKRKIPFEIETVPPPTVFALPQPPSGNNVVVTLGSGPADIVVCAHYDAANLPDRTLSKGAVDNGAAVVTLIRLAETLSTMKLKHRVRVVFFDMEEVHARGSSRFLLRHKNDPIKAAVNIDIVSSGNAVFFCPGTALGFRTIGRMMEEVCIDQGVPHIWSAVVLRSDQESFDEAGIRSIEIAVLPEAKAHQFWLAKNAKSAGLAPGTSEYSIIGAHSPEDQVSAVTPEAMATVYNVVLGIVAKLDAE